MDKGLPTSKYDKNGRPISGGHSKRHSSTNGLSLFLIFGTLYFIFIVIMFLTNNIVGDNIFYLILPFVFFWTYFPKKKKDRHEDKEREIRESFDPLKETDEDLRKIDDIIIDNNRRRGY